PLDTQVSTLRLYGLSSVLLCYLDPITYRGSQLSRAILPIRSLSRGRPAYNSHVFFFQAEDGIRDWSVTGVQTCALPIYVPLRQPRRREAEVPHERRPAARPAGSDHRRAVSRDVRRRRVRQADVPGRERRSRTRGQRL